MEPSYIYNKIIELSREKFLYSIIKIEDQFISRLILIFLHFAFLFKKFKQIDELDKKFSQNMFDYMFGQIEANIRELGYGDLSVNKKMKTYVNHFYDILLKCENYDKMNNIEKSNFFKTLFSVNNTSKCIKLDNLVLYFDKFSIFSSNLSFNHIKDGDINFIYY